MISASCLRSDRFCYPLKLRDVRRDVPLCPYCRIRGRTSAGKVKHRYGYGRRTARPRRGGSG